MSREDITLAIAVANFVLTWGVALYMYLANKNKATNERIGRLEDDIDAKFDAHTGAEEAKFDTISGQLGNYAERIRHLETATESAPTHEDLGRLHEKINRVADSNSRMEGWLQGISDDLRIIKSRIVDRGMQ